MRATIVCEKGSAICNLYLPWSHIYNPCDDRLSLAAFADKLIAIGYEVNGYEKVSVFNRSRFHFESGWVHISIQAQVHNGDFIPNLLKNVEDLTIDHPGQCRLGFANRQLTDYKI